MSTPPPPPPAFEQPPLTPAQEQIADILVRECGLQDKAGEILTMHGVYGRVRYGLGRCAAYFSDKTPAEIREMVLLRLDQQKTEIQEQ